MFNFRITTILFAIFNIVIVCLAISITAYAWQVRQAHTLLSIDTTQI